MTPERSKLLEHLPDEAWIRTCQECGHRQKDVPPDPRKGMTDAYRNRRCRRCRSEALDYGCQNASYWD